MAAFCATIVSSIVSAGSLAVATCALLTLRTQLQSVQSSVRQGQRTVAQARVDKIYETCNDWMDILTEHPEMAPYFIRDESDAEDPDSRDDRLRNQLAQWRRSNPTAYNRIRVFTDRLADFIDYCYVLRDLHPADDWRQWWQWSCDTYDNSFMLREHFAAKDSWFSVADVLSSPEKRMKAFHRDVSADTKGPRPAVTD